MKTYIVTCYLVATLISACYSTILKGQDNITTINHSVVMPANSNNTEEAHAHVFICYPIGKSGSSFSIFLNKKNIGKIANGGRIECRLLFERPLAITLIDGSTYHEPLTLSKNSRTLSIIKGKAYYFRIDASGELEYIFNQGKGEKYYTDTKEFISQPASFTETPASTIPALNTATN